MFCPQCGASTTDGTPFCSNCGRSLAPSTYPAQPGMPGPTAGPVPGGYAPTPSVENYLVFAILATVLCCLPAGIVAIVYASQVNSKAQSGDMAGALEASKNAKLWCWISAGTGLAVGVIWGLLAALGTLSHMH